MEKISFKQIFEERLKNKHISTKINIFNDVIKELHNIEYEIKDNKLTVENVENVSIDKKTKQLKVNGNLLQELGEYKNLKKNNNKVIIEFDEYIIRYFVKPISKLIIINKEIENEI